MPSTPEGKGEGGEVGISSALFGRQLINILRFKYPLVIIAAIYPQGDIKGRVCNINICRGYLNLPNTWLTSSGFLSSIGI